MGLGRIRFQRHRRWRAGAVWRPADAFYRPRWLLARNCRTGARAADDESEVETPRFTGLEKLLRNRVLVAFFGTVLIVWTANSAISAFFSIQLTQIGASQSLIGVAWAIGAAVEIPLMIVFPQLRAELELSRCCWSVRCCWSCGR